MLSYQYRSAFLLKAEQGAKGPGALNSKTQIKREAFLNHRLPKSPRSKPGPFQAFGSVYFFVLRGYLNRFDL